ncbi:MIT domain-containing protein 1-like [Lingula anatina]|uniref:MIT domain-containing protein 1-like n=1 Tax=Lingula anatina TaxID=7574 RepID=A0A1S3ISA8_LINAN|nr:MIT domain-containing protein 1-like [Lingula anatina]XP_013400959.1 MIT domain-containing protein 1-like [Lingula anatina]|eukprot:XP_013400958.1 MIT domain-containing protein 1-like [Lingula anatina]
MATPGVETSAIGLLKRAVELDGEKRFTESLVCYQEGIQLLLDVLKATTDEEKKRRFRQRITEYMDRAEKVKQHIEAEKEAGRYHEQMKIENNSTGNSYEKVFGRFFDEQVTVVEVEDPYIRSNHQVLNFVRFCELIVKSKSKVQTICLTTGQDQGKGQEEKLSELVKNLEKYNMTLKVTYSASLHDREIRLNNGWVIKIGRGLDYFKAADGKFVIGFCDMDLRQCHETTVDIFHKKHSKSVGV